MSDTITLTSSLKDKVRYLLAKVHISGDIGLHPLPGGGNNRIYRITAGNQVYCLKEYFHSASDSRNRGRTEFSFLSSIRKEGVLNIPFPYYYDDLLHMGVYEFIDGHKINFDEISLSVVHQAEKFIEEINRIKGNIPIGFINDASEACFSVHDHLQTVSRRINQFEKLTCSSTVESNLKRFIDDKLKPYWDRVKHWVHVQCGHQNLSMNYELTDNDKCLSPSDFGFHNSIVTTKQKLKFIDFEYAGWDDPAKLVCDFFCQPEIPVDLKYFTEFSRSISRLFPNQENALKRYKLLLPIYQLKWCCIMLNEFLPAGEERRQFAYRNSPLHTDKGRQLKKAESALGKININSLDLSIKES